MGQSFSDKYNTNLQWNVSMELETDFRTNQSKITDHSSQLVTFKGYHYLSNNWFVFIVSKCDCFKTPGCYSREGDDDSEEVDAEDDGGGGGEGGGLGAEGVEHGAVPGQQWLYSDMM